eukprot:TRINITY_DN43109_c0_g1_i1.p1 TRINITY_DN43109_c0_g1~~TRINITY_DN43109_c0_g1_i1.p1  ORF type:complete len:600 (-),score=100.54 TRINITY_DN43109_c0_g1_i1:97-1827(-)
MDAGFLSAAAGPGDESSVPQRLTGTVRSFQGDWGFLKSEGVDGDIFVHLKDCDNTANPLSPGDTVEFDLTSGAGGNQARATNISRCVEARGDAVLTEYGNLNFSGQGEALGTYSGVFASFRDGWGLILSDSLPEKLYCSQKDNPRLREVVPVPGDNVTFDLGTNSRDGRNKAINARVAPKEQMELVGQRVQGTVKSMRESWGFADSPRFIGGILLGTKNLAAAGLANVLRYGEPIEFEVAPGSKGQCEAINICRTQAPSAVMPVYQGQPPQQHFPIQAPMPAANGFCGSARERSRTPKGDASQAAPPATNGGQARITGTVRTCKDGWGFLVSPQVQGDVYMNMRDSPGLATPLMPGEQVTFSLAFKQGTSRNNGAMAMDVTRGVDCGVSLPQQQQPSAIGSIQPMSGGFGGQTPQSGGPGFGGGGDTYGGGDNGGGAPGMGKRQSGTLVMFRDGWGWIEAPLLGGQIFFGLRDNPQVTWTPTVGEALDFDIAPGPKDRHKAVNVCASIAGQRVQAPVKSMRDGWGFAAYEEVSGGVLLGKKNLMLAGISDLQVGEMLEFDLAPAAKGFEARNIRKC